MYEKYKNRYVEIVYDYKATKKGHDVMMLRASYFGKFIVETSNCIILKKKDDTCVKLDNKEKIIAIKDIVEDLSILNMLDKHTSFEYSIRNIIGNDDFINQLRKSLDESILVEIKDEEIRMFRGNKKKEIENKKNKKNRCKILESIKKRLK